MAVDTKAKRMSALFHLKPRMIISPDGTIDQGDRQSTQLVYCGILAGTPAAAGGFKIYKYAAVAKGVRGWR